MDNERRGLMTVASVQVERPQHVKQSYYGAVKYQTSCIDDSFG